MDCMIKVHHLVKHFSPFRLGPISFQIQAGEVVGLAGANGAGKSTTLKILTGMLKPDEGDITILGVNPWLEQKTWKYEVGYVADKQYFYEGWSAARNLAQVARFYPGWSQERAQALSQRFQLDLSIKAKNLSLGNRVKLALVMAMARSPKLLILDEPTTGLDPIMRAEVLDVFWEIMEDGEAAILYSTHLMGDLARIADRVIYLRQGSIIRDATVPDILESWRRISFRAEQSLPDLPAVTRQRQEGSSQEVISSDGQATLAYLQKQGISVTQETRLTLEEASVEILKN